jgi:hypothetical protein
LNGRMWKVEGGVIAYDTLYKTADSRTWYGERTDGDDLDSVDWDDVLLRPDPSSPVQQPHEHSSSQHEHGTTHPPDVRTLSHLAAFILQV